jgi:hypothetical protein
MINRIKVHGRQAFRTPARTIDGEVPQGARRLFLDCSRVRVEQRDEIWDGAGIGYFDLVRI